MIRANTIELGQKATGETGPKVLNESGENLRHVLWDWFSNSNDLFGDINRSFEKSSKIRIGGSENGDGLKFFEGYSKPIPIDKISDGTLRLLGYLILTNQPELPSLIASNYSACFSAEVNFFVVLHFSLDSELIFS